MTPERLSEIRTLSEVEVETFNSFTEERPSSGEMQAALREVLAYVVEIAVAVADATRKAERPSPFAEFDSLNPGDVVGAKGEEYTVVERDFPKDGVRIQTESGNDYLLYSEAWAGPYGWKLISRAKETGHEALEIPAPEPGKCNICEREIPVGEAVYVERAGVVTCWQCATAELN